MCVTFTNSNIFGSTGAITCAICGTNNNSISRFSKTIVIIIIFFCEGVSISILTYKGCSRNTISINSFIIINNCCNNDYFSLLIGCKICCWSWKRNTTNSRFRVICFSYSKSFINSCAISSSILCVTWNCKWINSKSKVIITVSFYIGVCITWRSSRNITFKTNIVNSDIISNGSCKSSSNIRNGGKNS